MTLKVSMKLANFSQYVSEAADLVLKNTRDVCTCVLFVIWAATKWVTIWKMLQNFV